MSGPLFGWDILAKSVESEIKSSEDVLVCFTHLVLLSSGFKCIGLGESKVLEDTATKSEVLPPGWSASYALRYINKGRLYILKCTKVDDGVLLNLIRPDERTTSLVQLNSSAVASRSGSLDKMIPKHEDLTAQIRTQLIEKVVVSKNTKDGASQTSAPQRDNPSQPQPLHLDQPSASGVPIMPLPIPYGVGEVDLNPFGRNPLAFPPPLGGGGMLFQPPQGGIYPQPPNFGLPPGAIPPGARFDPFRPPDVDRFPRRRNNRPDNDEFPPPGYDDMFM